MSRVPEETLKIPVNEILSISNNNGKVKGKSSNKNGDKKSVKDQKITAKDIALCFTIIYIFFFIKKLVRIKKEKHKEIKNGVEIDTKTLDKKQLQTG